MKWESQFSWDNSGQKNKVVSTVG